jgi:hypothetical protein
LIDSDHLYCDQFDRPVSRWDIREKEDLGSFHEVIDNARLAGAIYRQEQVLSNCKKSSSEGNIKHSCISKSVLSSFPRSAVLQIIEVAGLDQDLRL